MDQTLTDQQIADLVGDLGAYMGLPGPPQGETLEPHPGSAQHPFQPVEVYVAQDDDSNWQLYIGTSSGDGQRCMLPNEDGTPNPVLYIKLTGYHDLTAGPGITANSSGAPRYDILEGQAKLTYSGSGPGSLQMGAVFTYKEGGSFSAPPTVDANNGVVAVVIVPPGGDASNAIVQIVLPGLTFVAGDATIGEHGPGHPSYGSAPLMAAVITAQPFNTPFIAGAAQQGILPSASADAMASVQTALTFLGPGGAVYFPSGMYGVGSQATTQNAPPANEAGKNIGQTLIFGGAVTFVALGDYTAFELTEGAVVMGCPKFWDLGTGVNATTTEPKTFAGIGSPYSIDATIPTSEITITGQRIIITDAEGNTMTGTLTSAADGVIGFTSTFEQGSDGTVDPGSGVTLESGATMFTPVTTSAYAVVINGGDIRLDGLETNHWFSGLQITAMADSDLTSIRCLGVAGIGVQITNSGDIHDNHIGSIYCVSAGDTQETTYPQCGLEIDGEGGNAMNSLKIDHVECLGFVGVLGPTVHAYPLEFTSIPAPGVCMHGVKIKSIWITNIFTSSCGIGLYIDRDATDIGVALFNAAGDGSVYGDTANGFNLACVGSGSAHPVTNVYIGCIRAGRPNSGNPNNNLYGIYLKDVLNFHCDYGFVGDRNFTGVVIDAGCSSIGFDHLILANNGVSPGEVGAWGILADGSPAPQFISIDKLDISNETAPNGPTNLTGALHLSYNDLGSVNGYFTSDGSSAPNAGSGHGVTVGNSAGSYRSAIRIGNDSSKSMAQGYSVLGTDSTSGTALNSIYGILAAIWNALTGSTTPSLAIDDSGNLAIAGGLYLPGSSSSGECVVSTGSGAPGSGTPGNGKNGSIYINVTGTTGAHLYIYNSVLPNPPGWHAISGV